LPHAATGGFSISLRRMRHEEMPDTSGRCRHRAAWPRPEGSGISSNRAGTMAMSRGGCRDSRQCLTPIPGTDDHKQPSHRAGVLVGDRCQALPHAATGGPSISLRRMRHEEMPDTSGHSRSVCERVPNRLPACQAA
jgi:hypothetical protein